MPTPTGTPHLSHEAEVWSEPPPLPLLLVPPPPSPPGPPSPKIVWTSRV